MTVRQNPKLELKTQVPYSIPDLIRQDLQLDLWEYIGTDLAPGILVADPGGPTFLTTNSFLW